MSGDLKRGHDERKNSGEENNSGEQNVSKQPEEEGKGEKDSAKVAGTYAYPLELAEPACRATSIWPALTGLGNLIIQVEENSRCRKSLHTGYHIVRGEGNMRIYFTATGIPVEEPMTMRGVLVRKNELYRALCVERICEMHEAEADPEARNQVLQAGAGQKGCWQFGEKGPRRSIGFEVGMSSRLGSLQGSINLRIMCNDACITSKRTEQQPEASREMMLVLTIESTRHHIILARRSMDIWCKSRIVIKDLVKPYRLLNKRPEARQNKRQRRPNQDMGARVRLMVREARRRGNTLAELHYLVTSAYKGMIAVDSTSSQPVSQ